MTKVTVQYQVNSQYGEFVAKSVELSAQEMIDKMYASAKPGIAFRFLSENGFMVPTGYNGDERVYIASQAA